MKRIFLPVVVLAGCLGIAVPSRALAGTFTYQARLTVAGAVTNGNYDLRFRLMDASSGGTQIGGIVTNANTAITNGLFIASLDFGTNAFDGNGRWLELSVRTNGNSAFVTLAPRQPVTPSPMALFASTAAVVQGVIPDSQLSANIARLAGAQSFTAPQVIAPTAGGGPALTIIANSNTSSAALEIRNVDNVAMLTVTDNGRLNLGLIGTNGDALLNFGPPVGSAGNVLNFLRFASTDPDTNKTAGWVFGQSVGDNTAPDTDKSKNWFWGFNHDPSKPFGKESPYEPQLFWNMECNWDPFPPSNIRQMEYYLVYGSRSNNLGMRPFAFLLRDDSYIQVDFTSDTFVLNGIGGSNDEAAKFFVSRAAKGGASLYIHGPVISMTNSIGFGVQFRRG